MAYSKLTGDCCVFKFLQRSVDGKHLMRFQSETYVFKFLRRSVDEALKYHDIALSSLRAFPNLVPRVFSLLRERDPVNEVEPSLERSRHKKRQIMCCFFKEIRHVPVTFALFLFYFFLSHAGATVVGVTWIRSTAGPSNTFPH